MSKIPEQILQAGSTAYCSIFLNGIGSLGEAIEAAYFAIHDHEDWARAGTAAWNGEGLPPAGAEIEFTLNRGSIAWAKGTVIGNDGPHQVVIKYGRSEFHVRNIHGVRPIRTPEQIAADEKEKAILELTQTLINLSMSDEDMPSGSQACWRHAAERIHEADYRKQVAP